MEASWRLLGRKPPFGESMNAAFCRDAATFPATLQLAGHKSFERAIGHEWKILEVGAIALANFAGGVLENNIGEHGGV